ncbi:MAG: DUF4437 domain-containing protein [Alphaproteobacteria bacterium]|nr:MAG: DUF4437 domain-containing protein [Alphaproteobacteria bacterium]
MARPHCMFIMAQALPWEPGLYGSGRGDVESKILSIDEEGTNSTCIVRYPAGWQRSAPEYMTGHEEFLVLDGAIEINGRLYEKHTYGFLPRGYVRNSARSEGGAVLLTMFYDRPEFIDGMSDGYDEKLLVEYVNPLEMEWDPTLVDPQLAKGVAIKPLRTDPYTGESSFLYCSPPHRVPPGMAKPQWTHSVVEELYCIDGEYVWGDTGRMGPGGYAWWREEVYHGPSGTDTGYHLFVRVVNGPLDNRFDTEKKPFTWTPEYRPVLPERLKPFAKPYIRQPNY